MLSVVIVEDHSIVSLGLKALIDTSEKFFVKGVFSSGYEGLQKIKELKPDFAIIDLNLPDLGGEVVIKDLFLNQSKTKIIVLSWQKFIPQITHLVSLGIFGYVIKDTSAHEMLLALENANLGQKYISPSLNEVLLKMIMPKVDHSFAPFQKALTEREIEISKLICAGITPADISKKLNISHSTVRAHTKNILEKLGLKKISEIFKYRNHLLSEQ